MSALGLTGQGAVVTISTTHSGPVHRRPRIRSNLRRGARPTYPQELEVADRPPQSRLYSGTSAACGKPALGLCQSCPARCSHPLEGNWASSIHQCCSAS
jgi:hypothetical protein